MKTLGELRKEEIIKCKEELIKLIKKDIIFKKEIIKENIKDIKELKK